MSPSEPDRVSRPRFRGLPIKPAEEGTGLLPWSWAVARLRASRSYWLATTRPDGSPHSMPVWGVWLDDVLLFDTHPLSQKVTNLTRDPRAVVHLESADEVVILEGVVDIETEWEERLIQRFAAAHATKYGREPFSEEGGFVFEPRLGYAWDNSDFAGSATRFALD